MLRLGQLLLAPSVSSVPLVNPSVVVLHTNYEKG